MRYRFSPLLVFLVFFFGACNNDSGTNQSENRDSIKLKEINITYQIDSLKMGGYVVYDENNKEKRPGVLIIHEWWGINDYTKRRARELARLGYAAIAVDMYGNGKRGTDVASASSLATPFYKDPLLAKKHFDAALQQFIRFQQVDSTKLAAIGYCFGGGMALNLARLGEPLKGVVSFHGSLIGTPANKDLLKAEILVCHGNDDKFVPPSEVAAFRKQMDSIGAVYTFVGYNGATHAFSNPDATEMGKKFNIPIAYNEPADVNSWKEMKLFLEKIFK